MVHRNLFLLLVWHVLRHKNGFWLVFHQIHHSPSRIEVVTAFYKHPIEILSDAILSALCAVSPVGLLADGGVLVQLLCGDRRILLSRKCPNTEVAQIFYPNAGIAFNTSPIQRSSIQLFRHSALGPPVWDGEDTTEFCDRCGFPNWGLEKLGAMLAFKDVYYEEPV